MTYNTQTGATGLPILAAGCAFPSGPSLKLADAAVRAHLCLVRRHPFGLDRCGVRFNCSIFPAQTDPLYPQQRWKELANGAMWDLAHHLPQAIRPALQKRAIPLWLVLPDPQRPGNPAKLEDMLVDIFQKNWAEVHFVYGGHSACALALREIEEWSRKNNLPAMCLAIDTPYSSFTLSWLEALDLVAGSHTPFRGDSRANPYGRIPGEAAAALLIGPATNCPPWSVISGFAMANEPLTFDSEGPCIGAGLSEAARIALQQAATPQHGISDLIHDLNGEPYRGDEFGFTSLRLSASLAPDYRRHIPALASGDVMTASLAVHLALAAWRHKQKEASATQLILSSSDDPLRAALVLNRFDDSRQKT